MFLPDINVWLALAFPSHVHHVPALAWFNNSPAERLVYFCRYTQRGFLRLANTPRVFPQDAVTQDQAWALFDRFLADPRIEYASEPSTLETSWRQLTQLPQHLPNTWNDAYLAAFGITGNYEVVTFDKGFARFSGLKVTIL